VSEAGKADLVRERWIDPKLNAGPRNRAPLGFKTTNAKAKGTTPAATLKPEKTNKISRGQDIKKVAPHVHPSQFELQERLEEDVPDIEYMPPKPKGKKSTS
jgi:hypothetical protein